jgi:hypothetical protein
MIGKATMTNTVPKGLIEEYMPIEALAWKMWKLRNVLFGKVNVRSLIRPSGFRKPKRLCP